jgi:hypothetical protein
MKLYIIYMIFDIISRIIYIWFYAKRQTSKVIRVHNMHSCMSDNKKEKKEGKSINHYI